LFRFRQFIVVAVPHRAARVVHGEEMMHKTRNMGLPHALVSPPDGGCSSMMMKRAFDFCVALIGLSICWPLLLALMVAIRLESLGPAIFVQSRVGRSQKLFKCYKLRTMYEGTLELPSHQVAASAPTTIGRFLRRTKLDELPQLVNVLRGEMSLVGPRPCLPSQAELIAARLREGALDVLPGVTGLAQVQGVDMSNPLRLARIDGRYVRTRSFGGDICLICKTVVLAAGVMRRKSHRRTDPQSQKAAATKG
jgi:O-antigen biosynthesis protein WbqP